MASRIYLNTPAVDVLVAAAGLKNGEFARDYCGISAVTYSRLRNGACPRPSTLRAIALGLTRIKPLAGFKGIEGAVMTTRPAGLSPKKKEAEAGSIASAQEGQRVSANPK